MMIRAALKDISFGDAEAFFEIERGDDVHADDGIGYIGGIGGHAGHSWFFFPYQIHLGAGAEHGDGFARKVAIFKSNCTARLVCKNMKKYTYGIFIYE